MDLDRRQVRQHQLKQLRAAASAGAGATAATAAPPSLAFTPATRLALARCAKYCLGGLVYSIFDLEFCVLRAASAKPQQGALAAAFFAQSTSFAAKDPRRRFALDAPVPLVSFALIALTASSPALTVLREPFDLDGELRACARAYLQQHLYYDKKALRIGAPDLFRHYWKDFAPTKEQLPRAIAKLAPDAVAAELHAFVSRLDCKLTFSPPDLKAVVYI